ncbi:glycogen synthase GlgA [Caldicellulosiruptoraceae bacterium PP1]
MQVLFSVSECFPFAKSGGLADVAYALPKALRNENVDVRIIMPKYSDINYDFLSKMKHITHFNVPVGWRNQYCGIEYLVIDGIPVYFIDNEYYFKRPGYYGYYDDGERFSFFSRAVLETINHIDDLKPDIIHVNDWHTAIIPVLLNEHYRNSQKHKIIKTVLTIHNLKFQGIFGKEVLSDLLSLNDGYYSEDNLKFYEGISFLKGGIIFSDKVTTVSKTYSNEIKTLSYGEGLHGLLSGIGDKLVGIINGIDYEIYNPKTDSYIYKNYDVNSINDKKENKLLLQRELNLPISPDIPLIGIVSRLTSQKGFDLVQKIMEDILRFDIQLVILGAGDFEYEQMFKYYAMSYPSKVSANICYSEDLSRKIYAASDMFLMPSHTEPCGISQLIALRYGSIPIVRETGGLRDTVKPYNQYTGEGWGFSFSNYNEFELLNTIKYAISIFKNPQLWNQIIKQAMSQDNSWKHSAQEYKRLYSSILK